MDYLLLFFKKVLRYVLKPLSFLPAFIMIYIIFSFSSQSGTDSGSLSLKVTTYMVNVGDAILNKNYDTSQLAYYIEYFHPYVRKLAHVTEYFFLAVSVAFPLYVYRLRGFALVVIAGTICIGVACLDEYAQTFIAGRVGCKEDVLIDCIGIFPGIYCTRIFGFIGRKTVFRWLSLEENRRKQALYEETLSQE
ncbi:MAG: VanZ family protein [Eubacteriales bacterium]